MGNWRSQAGVVMVVVDTVDAVDVDVDIDVDVEAFHTAVVVVAVYVVAVQQQHLALVGVDEMPSLLCYVRPRSRH